MNLYNMYPILSHKKCTQETRIYTLSIKCKQLKYKGTNQKQIPNENKRRISHSAEKKSKDTSETITYNAKT